MKNVWFIFALFSPDYFKFSLVMIYARCPAKLVTHSRTRLYLSPSVFTECAASLFIHALRQSVDTRFQSSCFLPFGIGGLFFRCCIFSRINFSIRPKPTFLCHVDHNPPKLFECELTIKRLCSKLPRRHHPHRFIAIHVVFPNKSKHGEFAHLSSGYESAHGSCTSSVLAKRSAVFWITRFRENPHSHINKYLSSVHDIYDRPSTWSNPDIKTKCVFSCLHSDHGFRKIAGNTTDIV